MIFNNNNKYRVLSTNHSSSENMKGRWMVWPVEVPSRQSFGGKEQLYSLGTHKLRAINIKIQSDWLAMTYYFHDLKLTTQKSQG